jgi:predicted nuclease with TOPRIM domain
MRDELQARLELLRKEWETGGTRLRELERQQAQLSETMLRISGAIQVLEELVEAATESGESRPQTDGAASTAETEDEVPAPGG